MHTAYFSMYLLFAISIIIVFYNKWYKTQKSIIYSSYAFVFIFSVCIILCSSKIGILSLLIIVIILFYYKFKTILSLKNIGVFILSLSLIIITINKLLPNSLDRLNSLTNISSKHQDKKSSESTTLRILIWKQSINLIKNNFLLGTGVGDANDELYKRYQLNGIEGAYDKKLNAHNQFLQTFIGIGLFGFILLCIISIGQIFIAYNNKNIIMFVFFVIISLNFFVESMLQTSAGVLFFVFFFCLINKSKIYIND
jgi:O-antigen ligase